MLVGAAGHRQEPSGETARRSARSSGGRIGPRAKTAVRRAALYRRRARGRVRLVPHGVALGAGGRSAGGLRRDQPRGAHSAHGCTTSPTSATRACSSSGRPARPASMQERLLRRQDEATTKTTCPTPTGWSTSTCAAKPSRSAARTWWSTRRPILGTAVQRILDRVQAEEAADVR